MLFSASRCFLDPSPFPSLRVQMVEDEMDVMAKENSTGKVYMSGFDKQGRPVMVMRPRNENTMDHDGNIKHMTYQVQPQSDLKAPRGDRPREKAGGAMPPGRFLWFVLEPARLLNVQYVVCTVVFLKHCTKKGRRALYVLLQLCISYIVYSTQRNMPCRVFRLFSSTCRAVFCCWRST